MRLIFQYSRLDLLSGTIQLSFTKKNFMTHVLHVYKSYFPETRGGIEQFIQTLTSATQILGIKNTLLTTTQQSLDSNHRDPLEIIRAQSNFIIASCPFSLEFFRHFQKIYPQYPTIHLHFPWPFGELVTRLLVKSDHQIVVTYHADITRQKYLKKIYIPLMHSLFKRADRIVATSPNLLASSSILQKYAAKATVIPLSLNPLDYEAKPFFINKWQTQVGKNFLLFIGQFRYYKGIEMLLRALEGTQIPCILAGEGPLKLEMQKLASKLKLDHLKFIGTISENDKAALIELSRGVILPSTHRSEAFGLSLLEGLAFNKPLISTELGTGTSFVNQNGKTGWVVPPRNPLALRQAILELFKNDNLCNQFQQASKKYFEEYFQLNKIANQYKDIYLNNDSQ